MKRSAAVIFLVLMSATSWGLQQQQQRPINGQSIKEQLAALMAEAAPYIAKSEENKKVLTALNQTSDDIMFGVAALTKSVNNYKTDFAAYTVDKAALDKASADYSAALDAHNAHQCIYPQGSSACDSYNREAAALVARHKYLQSQSDDLNSRGEYLNQTKKKNMELGKILSDKTEKYTSDTKAYNAQNDANNAKLEDIARRILALKAQLKPCLDKLPPNPTDEMLHDKCGQLWDGNTIHSAPVNKGTGTKGLGSK